MGMSFFMITSLSPKIAARRVPGGGFERPIHTEIDRDATEARPMCNITLPKRWREPGRVDALHVCNGYRTKGVREAAATRPGHMASGPRISAD